VKIYKVLNNNTVVVRDGDIEKIVMGPGIGFQKKKNDLVLRSKIEKVFVIKEENEKFQMLLQTLPIAFIEVAQEIINYAEKELQVSLSSHVHIALADHLTMALERLEKGIQIENKLLNEIKVLYKREFDIGLWAREKIKERFSVDLPEADVAHITLLIHTAKDHSPSLEKTMKRALMIKEITGIIEDEVKRELIKNSFVYQSLLSHLRYAVYALENKESFSALDPDMLEMIKIKYPKSFEGAKKINEHLRKEYNLEFPESELGYISLHIQRIQE